MLVAVFRRDGWTTADYRGWSDRLLDDRVAFVAPSSPAGEPVLRSAIISVGAKRPGRDTLGAC